MKQIYSGGVQSALSWSNFNCLEMNSKGAGYYIFKLSNRIVVSNYVHVYYQPVT